MITLYVYETENNTLVARITGDSNDDCEGVAGFRYGDTDTFGWTYSPAFGFAGGLLPGENVQDIDASTRRVCGRCGYEGVGWLDDGETCPECKLVQ